MTRKILVVTDNKAVADLITYTALMLTKLNHQVTIDTETELGPALANAAVSNTDMLLLDLDAKSLNPYDLITGMRENPDSAKKKILAFTSELTPEKREKANAAGCDSIMSLKEFQNVVSNILQF